MLSLSTSDRCTKQRSTTSTRTTTRPHGTHTRSTPPRLAHLLALLDRLLVRGSSPSLPHQARQYSTRLHSVTHPPAHPHPVTAPRTGDRATPEHGSPRTTSSPSSPSHARTQPLPGHSPAHSRMASQPTTPPPPLPPASTAKPVAALPVFPLSQVELQRWYRFAQKGGVGRARAKVDKVSQDAARDLMFLEGDEVVVLMDLGASSYLVRPLFSPWPTALHSELTRPVARHAGLLRGRHGPLQRRRRRHAAGSAQAARRVDTLFVVDLAPGSSSRAGAPAASKQHVARECGREQVVECAQETGARAGRRGARRPLARARRLARESARMGGGRAAHRCCRGSSGCESWRVRRRGRAAGGRSRCVPLPPTASLCCD